jgi:hypothetical protein
LVVAQVALSVRLLSAAGLFIGHLSNLERLDLGFRRDRFAVRRRQAFKRILYRLLVPSREQGGLSAGRCRRGDRLS